MIGTPSDSAFVTFDGHRTGDKQPYVYRTTNLGATWQPITTPAVDGGMVYGLGPNGHLFAVKLEDGSPVWTVQIEEAIGTYREITTADDMNLRASVQSGWRQTPPLFGVFLLKV